MTALRQQLLRSLAAEGVRPRVVRTLADVLADIQRVGPVVWKRDNALWAWMDDEARGEVLDRLDELQAEARALIESATGCKWDAIQEACL